MNLPDKDSALLRHADIYFKVEEDGRELPLFIINGSEYSSPSAVSADLKEAWQVLGELRLNFVRETKPVQDIGIYKNLPRWTEYRKKLGKIRKRKE